MQASKWWFSVFSFFSFLVGLVEGQINSFVGKFVYWGRHLLRCLGFKPKLDPFFREPRYYVEYDEHGGGAEHSFTRLTEILPLDVWSKN